MYSNICVLKIYCRGPHPDLITKLILITVLYIVSNKCVQKVYSS